MVNGQVVSTWYICPQCGKETVHARAWQTARADLNRHRKEAHGIG